MGHLVPLFRTFALGFKARVDLLASVFLHLHTMDSLDSPLVRRFYSSSQQAWQLNHFDPHTFSSIGGTQQTGTRTDLANSARLDLAYYSIWQTDTAEYSYLNLSMSYTRQFPSLPHVFLHSRHVLSKTRPIMIGPGINTRKEQYFMINYGIGSEMSQFSISWELQDFSTVFEHRLSNNSDHSF